MVVKILKSEFLLNIGAQLLLRNVANDLWVQVKKLNIF